MHRCAFISCLHDEFFRQLSIGESRQAEHARRVGSCRIASKLVRKAAQKSFRVVLTETTYFPDDLMFARRGIENKVWSRDRGRIANCFKGFVALAVEVEIDVADILYIVFRAVVSTLFDR